jgi:hypothetical protein
MKYLVNLLQYVVQYSYDELLILNSGAIAASSRYEFGVWGSRRTMQRNAVAGPDMDPSLQYCFDIPKYWLEAGTILRLRR